ncbi:MAG: trimeric intracellular cation channel family protein [Desulfobacteraceae bacterium]|nr:trimeric intracellular cation channel family protein [Desulfobacteraceae bacterium]
MIYYLGLGGIAAFAITGVIAAGKKDMDIFSIVLLGVVTALGGGTLRDIIIDANPIFWIADLSYLWVSITASLFTFFLIRFVTHLYQLLLFVDAFGLALFTILAAEKTMLLGFPKPVAVLMGVVTGIAGGMIRDILTGKMPLLLSREFYATPALLGAILFILMHGWLPGHNFNRLYAIALIFGLRALTIQFKLYYPSWLTFREITND